MKSQFKERHLFNALKIEKDNNGQTSSKIQPINIEDLPKGNVTVAVEYSTLNYKDALCLSPGGGGLVRNYPHVPGIDFAGVVEHSSDVRYNPGDKVISTGWHVGERYWGGYAQRARINADWLVPVPSGLNTYQAMSIGTAGFTAILAILALENHGLVKDNGPVLVTGAAGGVGSIAIAALKKLGYEITAVTGRPETEDYLKELGASQIMPRDEINHSINKPLESATWNGCIDAVGGSMLGRVLGQMKYNASVALVGNAGGPIFSAAVIPFLLRGINLLGIDSVTQPYEQRIKVWHRIMDCLPIALLDKIATPAKLSDIPNLAEKILNGQVRGRVVVDVNQ